MVITIIIIIIIINTLNTLLNYTRSGSSYTISHS